MLLNRISEGQRPANSQGRILVSTQSFEVNPGIRDVFILNEEKMMKCKQKQDFHVTEHQKFFTGKINQIFMQVAALS